MALTLVYFFRPALNHIKNFYVAIDSEHILAKIVVITINISVHTYEINVHIVLLFLIFKS